MFLMKSLLAGNYINESNNDKKCRNWYIICRAGVRLRVINTDAEGRMAMLDVLCHMKEKALKEVNPHLMTIATLTGKHTADPINLIQVPLYSF